MAWCIHTIMQDANDGNTVRGCAKVKYVPPNTVAAIAWPYMITGGGNFW
jgi:hypothetical protein